MTCRPLFCDHSCNEGRDCPLTLQMHRIPGLHTDNGGKAVQGGFGVSLSVPLAEVPEPIPTPEQAEGWAARFWQWFLAAIAACMAAVAITYFNT